ncbi:MAG: aminotransferase class V-fold PLP-dependent enzyme [Gemmatimonadota bacterium]
MPDRRSIPLSRRGFLRTTAAGVALSPFGACGAGVDDPAADRPPLRAPAGTSDAAWADVRAQFLLDPGVVYMNHASLGMPPAQVVEAVHSGYAAISREPLHGKHALQEQIADVVLPGLAALLGVAAHELSLTRNASEALHLQTVGARLEPGDEVLITTQEHPAGSRPWAFRQSRDGVAVREVFIPSPLPSTGEVLERMEAAFTPRTRAIAFCHVTRGGHRYPVRELAELAHARDLLCLVDGAQAVGQFPIDLSELGCDAYSASLHKWMLGPAGTGFLYVREEARSRIRTAFAHDATLEAPAYDPPGTADFPVRAALAASLDFVRTLGLGRIEERCRVLSDHLKARLAEVPGLTLVSGARELSAPASTIFVKGDLDALAAVPLIEERAGTHIDEHQRDGHNAIRVSTAFYNTTAEIDRLVEVIAEARA